MVYFQPKKQEPSPDRVDTNKAQTPKLSPGLPRGAQTVTNKFPPPPGVIKDTNLRNMEGVQTVKVTNQTSSPVFAKSLGSFFSNVNKSVTSAFNSIMSFQPQDFSSGLKPEHAAQHTAPGMGSSRQEQSPSPSPTRQLIRPNTNVHLGNRPPPPASVLGARQVQPPQALRPTSSPHGPVINAPRTPTTPSFPRSPRSRSPSPRRDIDFSAAVFNLCDQAHSIAERDRRQQGGFSSRKGGQMYPISNILSLKNQFPCSVPEKKIHLKRLYS